MSIDSKIIAILTAAINAYCSIEQNYQAASSGGWKFGSGKPARHSHIKKQYLDPWTGRYRQPDAYNP
jgi:hypothetical protein